MERNWYKEKPNMWETAEWLEKVNQYSHYNLAWMLRHSSTGATPIFTNCTKSNPVWIRFKERWKEFGGWTPGLSKAVGTKAP